MSGQLVLLSLADIFSIYPKIFKELLLAEELKRSREGALAKDFLYLPSDAEWQEKVYYRLLEVQKKVNEALESGIAFEEVGKKKEKPIFDLDHVYRAYSPISSPSPTGFLVAKKKRCNPDIPISFIDVRLLTNWSLELIAKAGKLLQKPPISVGFDDEHEMRKVFSLIYDVFRYKNVLSQALIDASFYAFHPDLEIDQSRVWLILFDLFCRDFLKRPPEETANQQSLYKDAKLDHNLWIHRIRLAAAISRLRVKNRALRLAQLLPTHLQDEKVAIAAANPIVTGWMNPFKIKDKSAATLLLEKMKLTEVIEPETGTEKPLKLNQYKWDKVCPLFLSCIPGDKSKFAQSDIVRNHMFIMQDRTFSLGPAILSKLLDHFELDGDMVQTHVSSPRSTAYLAALFYSINRVNDFFAFGAGQNIAEYREYIKTLGVNNIRVFAENFCKLSLDASILETVVGVFATPPNSYSGVSDPIDLICSRGGDLSMLEVLTESEISSDGKCRVAQLLEEQRETLRLAMSRPQVQFIIYETHSIVNSENEDMVQRAVEDINRCAFEKHLLYYKEKKRLEMIAEMEAAQIPSAAFQSSSPRRKGGAAASAATTKSEEAAKAKKARRGSASSVDSEASNLDTARASSDDYTQNVKVPKTDEFLVSDVPDVCQNQDLCVNFHALGFHVSLIQRKQITRLNAKYLIQMAENRGLFGSADRSKSAKPKTSKRPEKRPPKKELDDDAKKARSKKNDIASLIERINQPTHASINRSHLQKISSAEKKMLKFDIVRKSCSRHSKHHADDYYFGGSNAYLSNLQLDSRAKLWWQQTTDYVQNLRSLQKKHEREKKQTCSLEQIKESLSPLRLTKLNNDLYTFRSEKRPKLQLVDRYPFPVAIHQLEFEGFSISSQKKIAKATDESGYWTT